MENFIRQNGFVRMESERDKRMKKKKNHIAELLESAKNNNEAAIKCEIANWPMHDGLIKASIANSLLAIAYMMQHGMDDVKK